MTEENNMEKASLSLEKFAETVFAEQENTDLVD